MSSTLRSSSADCQLSAISTGYGAQALDALRGCISISKGSDALVPVTVIVPNNLAGVVARRALAGGNHGPVVAGLVGFANIDFLTVEGFADLFGRRILAENGKRRAGAVVVAAAVRAILEKQPGILGPVARHPNTERQLLAAYRDLSQLDDSQLEALAGAGTRARDVVRIHHQASAVLRDRWYEEQELFDVASRVVLANTDRVALPASIVVYLPQRLSPQQAYFLRAVATRCPTTVLVGFTGVESADAAVVASLSLLGLDHPGTPPATTVSATVEMTNTSDADDEVRAVVRGIVDAAHSGSPFDRMAVLHPGQGPYPRLLHDHLEAAGIPINARAVTTLAQTIAGRTLRRLLLLAQHDYRREDVVALFAASPLRWEGHAVPGRAWDQISRDAGIVKGKADWHERLDTFVQALAAQRERLTGRPEDEWRAQQLADRIRLADSLHAFVSDLELTIGRGRTLSGWGARSRWCGELLDRYLANQGSWPEEQRRATEQIQATLATLGGLDSVEPEVSIATFDRTLHEQLERQVTSAGGPRSGVLVGPIGLGVGLDLDHLWVLGMNEGSLPGRQRDDSLLPELRAMNAGLDDEHRYFLAALASAEPHGVAHLMRPRGDLRRSGDRAPSRWLVDLAVQRSGRSLQPADLDQMPEPWSHHIPSFVAGLMQARLPATIQEFDLRTLVNELETHGRVAPATLALIGSSLSAGAALQAGRASDAFTRFDGNLGAVMAPQHEGSSFNTSATALETYARCPHQYLMRHKLQVNPLESPEYRIRVDRLTRGNIIHRVLERFVTERGLRRESQGAVRWSAQDHEQLQLIAEEEFRTAQQQGLTGEALFWRRDKVLLMRDLDAFVDADNDRRAQGGLQPIATELAFGLGDAPAVEIPLDDGHTIFISGSIDLVDQDPSGDLTIVDYKTGRASGPTIKNPHSGGTRLQLVLYALAAQQVLHRSRAQVTSMYWHVTVAEKYRTVGYVVTPEIAALTLDAVATIAKGISAGVFPQHPPASGYRGKVQCAYCDPDGMGTHRARRRLRRKAGQTELADYLRLTEPDLLPGGPG